MNGVKKGILSITFWVLYLCQANEGSRETGQIQLLKGFSLSMYLPVIYSKATRPQYPGAFLVQMDSEGPELGYSLSDPSTCPDSPLLLAALVPTSFNLTWIKTCRFSRWRKWEAVGEF